jgi:hypothetical protein
VAHFSNQLQTGAAYVNLLVAPSQPRQDALQKSNLPIPPPLRVRGLLDTGSSKSAIDTHIVQSLGLHPTGSELVHTLSTWGTPHHTITYDVSIMILGSGSAIKNTFVVPALAVTESALKYLGFEIVIGRDVLAHCLFVYDGRANLFSVAF